jgi:hypothetical protein
MDSRESLQILRNDLLRRGLPRDYIERVTSELADHADDMAAATGRSSPAPARLGDPLRLAEGIAREFRRRTFLGRHPCFTFLALPVGAMIAVWLAATLSIEVTVALLLAIAGETPSDAWRWAAAIVAGVLAFGMTYVSPAIVCWWALRKARQTTHAWSWAWAATAVLLLTSCVFRLCVFRLDNGRFGIDSSGMLRGGVTCLACLINGETMPPLSVLWPLMKTGSFSLGYLAQVAVLVGATAWAIRHSRQALASLFATAPTEHAEVA